MTRQEAAELLEKDSCYECSIGCCGMAKCKEDSCKLKEAVLVAIKALTVPSPEEMEDDGK